MAHMEERFPGAVANSSQVAWGGRERQERKRPQEGCDSTFPCKARLESGWSPCGAFSGVLSLEGNYLQYSNHIAVSGYGLVRVQRCEPVGHAIRYYNVTRRPLLLLCTSAAIPYYQRHIHCRCETESAASTNLTSTPARSAEGTRLRRRCASESSRHVGDTSIPGRR